MDEKIIIQSERYNIKKMLAIFIVLAAAMPVLVYIIKFNYYYQDYNTNLYWKEWAIEKYGSAFNYALYMMYLFKDEVIVGFIFGTVILAIGFIAYFWLSKIELTVSDKRVYGVAAFGKRVDLPFDSISAIGTGWPKGIAVATSSGKISFLAIKNCDEIHNVLSRLLIERQGQQKSVVQTTIKQEIPQSNADELKKYKELLDSGIISQEEFDAKKKQLLGL